MPLKVFTARYYDTTKCMQLLSSTSNKWVESLLIFKASVFVLNVNGILYITLVLHLLYFDIWSVAP